MIPVRILWRRVLAPLLVAFIGLAQQAFAQDIQPVPALTGRVIDRSATLGDAQRAALDAKLAAFEQEAGSQLVVLLVSTTQPEDIAAYGQRVADAWKIGRKDVGDGLLIVVAKDDRRVRIEVAKALEGAIPDLAAKQIIDRAITPAFRAGDFAGGLNAGIDLLAARIRGEALPPPRSAPGASMRNPDRDGGWDWGDLGIFFFVGVPIAGAVLTGMLGRKLGSLATGAAAGGLGWLAGGSLFIGILAGVVAMFLVGVMGVGAAGRRGSRSVFFGSPPIIWGGSSSHGWGGGGGFSSGGGGDFGGGGASGNW